MAFQTIRLAVGIDLIDGEEAAQGEHCIQRGGAVSLGEDQPVAVFPARVLRIEGHDVEVQDSQDFGHG